MLLTLFRLIALPHELLHVLAFKLIRKPYRCGDLWVEATAEMSRGEKLLVSLLPVAVTGLLAIAAIVAAPLVVRLTDSQVWRMAYVLLACGLAVYASFSLADLRNAYRIWTGRERTPFDWFIELNDRLVFRRRERLTPLFIILALATTALIILIFQKP